MKNLFFAFALFLASPALASEIDFTRHILDLDGKDIPVSADKDAPITTLARVAETALLNEPPVDPRQPVAAETPDQKRQRFDLALRIYQAKGAVTLSSEEVTLVKNAIAAIYGPLVVGRAAEILDPVPAKP